LYNEKHILMTETVSNSSELPSFNEIFAKYYHQIKAFLYTETHNMEQAEDLTQEVFIKIYKVITQPEQAYNRPEAGKLKAWIYTCAHNRFLDYIRSKDSSVMADAESVEMLAETDGHQPESDLREDPLHVLLHQASATTLKSGIHSLEPGQRDVMICRHLMGLTIPETAMELNIPEGTVKSRESRGRERLSQWYLNQSATALPDDFMP